MANISNTLGPSSITIQSLVTIRPNGVIEYGPDYTPDAAAKVFWEALGNSMPADRKRVGELQAEISRLTENQLLQDSATAAVMERAEKAEAELSALRSQPQGEPVGKVVTITGSVHDIAMIEWTSEYRPTVGDLIYAAPPADGVVVPKIVIQALRDRIAMAYGDLPKDCPPGPPTGILATLDALLAAPKGGE